MACPECEAEVPTKTDTEAGELISCPDCGSELEVKSINPVVLEKAPEEEEDWGE
jgi:alpha-aminoadipate/glutamate carrier protein LysW